MMLDAVSRPVWAEIDCAAIRQNTRALRSLTRPGVKFCAVVKADGYGHGALRVAREAEAAGAEHLAVALLQEALELRQGGFTLPILVLGYTPSEQAALVAAAGVAQTVFTLDQAAALSAAGVAAGTRVPVHVKIDTGMNRIGVSPEDAADFAAAVSALRGVALEGVFTHFATADSADTTDTRRQFQRFTAALSAIQDRGIRIPLRHAANSAALLDFPEAHLDMVRAGIALYGLWPSAEVSRPVELIPAMRLFARVAMVKTLPAGQAISYGGTHVTQRESVIATLPLGYADGWARRLGNGATVLVNGQRCPVVGRVCMDQCMVDVTGAGEVREGDVIQLFGGPELPVEEVADVLGTINYEVVCMLSKRVPRSSRLTNSDSRVTI